MTKVTQVVRGATGRSEVRDVQEEGDVSSIFGLVGC